MAIFKLEVHNMTSIGIFPFGQPVREIVQTDRTPKRIFVLGVYASAVHAHWIGPNNKTIVKALAVASEPYIFWRGEDEKSIIQQICVPPLLGKLMPADKQFNSPSGVALDDLILNPLGLSRSDAWLCDLVPHSCVNPSQTKAIEREYIHIALEYGLPKSTVPRVPTILTDEKRRKEIMDEIIESESRILILLGDMPIKWFLSYFDNYWKKLSDFSRASQPYGQLHNTHIAGKEIKVLPLAHPRQIAKLGQSSAVWQDIHETWLEQSTTKVARKISGL
jgi:uracil-DNA glycosylase